MMDRKTLFVSFFIISIAVLNLTAQEVHLRNPSFEGRPGANKVPDHWMDCGLFFKGESPPDLHPDNLWKVTQTAMEGDTYVGMVVRENDTWESISQKLTSPLIKNVKYQFQIGLTLDEKYISATRQSREMGQEFNFKKSAKLRIWGGNDQCSKEVLLAETKSELKYDWKMYDFVIESTTEIKYITFEAYYFDEKKGSYNGHLMMDNASAFVPIE